MLLLQVMSVDSAVGLPPSPVRAIINNCVRCDDSLVGPATIVSLDTFHISISFIPSNGLNMMIVHLVCTLMLDKYCDIFLECFSRI
ncbi:hypothetical protein J6590_049556 [Homalodisca vitripennis]|nr:hypothetical protein J6590_049556 [Homalodisca vitripennis]